MSSGEAAGKVLQAEGRDENSQSSGRPPGPGSLGTGRRPGRWVCIEDVFGGGAGRGWQGQAAVGLRRAVTNHAKCSAFSVRRRGAMEGS